MSAAQILAGEKGAALHEELVGVAVGFDEDGKLSIVYAGLELLGPQQRRVLIDELETAAAILRRGQAGRSH